MALLELLHDQRLHVGPFPPDVSSAAGMLFHESHYGRLLSDPGRAAKDPLEESSGSSESFAVVSENGNGNEDVQMTGVDSGVLSAITSMVEVSNEDLSLSMSKAASAAPQTLTERDQPIGKRTRQEGAESRSGSDGDGRAGTKQSRQESGEGDEDSCDEDDDNDSIVTVRPKDIERHATLIDLAASIKAFVGKVHFYSVLSTTNSWCCALGCFLVTFTSYS